jgi:hypothetical protein
MPPFVLAVTEIVRRVGHEIVDLGDVPGRDDVDEIAFVRAEVRVAVDLELCHAVSPAPAASAAVMLLDVRA